MQTANYIKHILERDPNLKDFEKANLENWVAWFEATLIELKPGDIVQVDPTEHEVFGGHFFVIHEIHNWGVTCYTQYLKKRLDFLPKQFHFKEIAPCGKAKWVQDISHLLVEKDIEEEI